MSMESSMKSNADFWKERALKAEKLIRIKNELAEQEFVGEIIKFSNDSGNYVFSETLERYLKLREKTGKLKHSNLKY